MKNTHRFKVSNLVTGLGFHGIAEIQSIGQDGKLECVTECGDSFHVLPENLTLYCEPNPVAKWSDGSPVITDAEGIIVLRERRNYAILAGVGIASLIAGFAIWFRG